MLYTTSKGQQVNSDLTHAEAAKIIKTAKLEGFPAMLCASVENGHLSAAQTPWLHLYAQKAITAAKPVKVKTQSVDASAVIALLKVASSKLKFPKLTFDADGKKLRMSIAGAGSKYKGSVTLTDGKPFGQNQWFGVISAEGVFTPAQNCPEWVKTSVHEFAANPTGYAKLYGQKTGNCCFCGRELSTTESVAVGYGPICAENYGLPWGE